MFKDKANQKLLGVLVLLILLYAGSVLIQNRTGRSAALRTGLARLDTTAVTRIEIGKPGKAIQIEARNKEWNLTTEEGITVNAEKDKVANMLNALMHLTPDRVATDDPGKWRDYQVDSTGTRTQIWEGDKKTLDLVIGRFGMSGQTDFFTYVRPYESNQVFAVSHFSGSSISPESSHYRNRNILSITPDSIVRIVFNYPDGEESFSLTRNGTQWNIDNVPVDSASVVTYLGNLRRISSSSFEDKNKPAPAIQPHTDMEMISSDQNKVVLGLYSGPDDREILKSSQNPENYFSDTTAVNKLFWPKEKFLRR